MHPSLIPILALRNFTFLSCSLRKLGTQELFSRFCRDWIEWLRSTWAKSHLMRARGSTGNAVTEFPAAWNEFPTEFTRSLVLSCTIVIQLHLLWILGVFGVLIKIYIYASPIPLRLVWRRPKEFRKHSQATPLIQMRLFVRVGNTWKVGVKYVPNSSMCNRKKLLKLRRKWVNIHKFSLKLR